MAVGFWYGLHPALIEPVAMVMARSDVACAAGVIWALLGWVRWRRGAGWPWAGVHLTALIVALGSKESAVVLAPALTVAAFLRDRADREGPPGGREDVPEVRGGLLDDTTWRRRLIWVAPAWVVTGLYLVGRRTLLGSAGALTVDLDPVRLLMAGGRYLYGLPPFRFQSALQPIARDPGLDWIVPVTALLGWLLFAVALAFFWRRRQGQAISLALLIPLSLAPVLLVSQLNVPVAASRYALADRWALPAIAAGAVLLALIGNSLARRPVSLVAGWPPPSGWLVTLALSGRTHAAYRDTETLAASQDARYQATPERLRALEDRCDYLERRLHQALRERDPARALAQAGAPPPGCPHPARFTLLRLVALTHLRRFSEASAEAARLEGEQLEPRYHGQAAYHAGLAHAETGDLDRAETELRQASRLGHRSCNLPTQLGRLLARRNQLRPAAQEYERAAACSPGDPRPLLAAASLWAAATDPARARGLLGRINFSALPPELRATYNAVKMQVEGSGR